MWEPQRLTTLWASTACYRDRFTLLHLQYLILELIITYCPPLDKIKRQIRMNHVHSRHSKQSIYKLFATNLSIYFLPRRSDPHAQSIKMSYISLTFHLLGHRFKLHNFLLCSIIKFSQIQSPLLPNIYIKIITENYTRFIGITCGPSFKRYNH
jgi:hypothetical protein